MRRIARLATIGLSLALGCTNPQAGNGRGTPLQLATDKKLQLAFDDIPAPVAESIPLSLTASDGTGLKLVSLKGRAVIDDPLAFTELTLVFENPNDRVLEGTFSMVLPQGAAISRFAMRNDMGFQEGEIVEKQQARVAYEDFLHRRQDPALLEQAAGNEFSARVFPIPARGRKELIVSYSQELSKRRPFTIPLKGMPEIGSVDIEAHVAGKAAPVLSVSKQGLKPEGDFKVDPSLLGDRAGLRNGNLVLARVTPMVGSSPEPLTGALFLVDTSASRALGMAEQGRILKQLAAGIAKASGAKTPVMVAAYDQAVEPIFAGGAGDVGDDTIGRIRQRLALGASNLEAALAFAGEQARAHSLSRVVLLTDGVATAGQTSGEKLREKVAALRTAGVERIDAVALGGIRDDDLLKSLVNAGLPRGGVVVDGAMTEEEQWRRLNEATRSDIAVKVENAVFTFPSKIDGVQAGDEVLVYANVPEDKPVRITIGNGPATTPDLAKVERPLLERAWVGAKIKSLVERERVEGASPALSREIVGLSTQYRVMSPKTSLLVLETDWDYQRFGIDRRALADILITDGANVSLMHRVTPAPPKPPPVVVVQKKPEPPKPKPVATAKAPTVRSAGASVSGGGSGQGFGSGHGRLGGSHATASAPAPAMKRDPDSFGGGMFAPGTVSGGGAGFAVGADPRPSAGAAAPSPMRDRAEEAKEKASEQVSACCGPPRTQPPRDAAVDEGSAGPMASAAPTAAATGAPVARPVTTPTTPAATATSPSTPPAAPASNSSGSAQGYGYLFSDDPARPPAGAAALAPRDERPSSGPRPAAEPAPAASIVPDPSGRFAADSEVDMDGDPSLSNVGPAPYTGNFKAVMDLIARGRVEDAIVAAFEWRKKEPGDVMALIALGEGFEAAGDVAQAARCYGSIIDLFSSRADLRRFAGERLDRLRLGTALDLASDTYQKAEEERPDHPASHRLYAYALLRRGQPEQAFEAIVRGIHQRYPAGRFAGVDRILREDLGLIGAAWARLDPKREEDIQTRVRTEGGAIENEPSIRFVLNWETDANDVDFHIRDGKGGHAFYSAPDLPSGGSLYADVTTGYGPECFTIRGKLDSLSYPYRLQAHYYSRGPMGYGMGKLEIVTHDGRGKLTFEERPFIVMVDRAFVDLGTVQAPSAKRKPGF
ncbi:MAG: VIT domain-containing protein [Polyangiaceae bacterium]